MLSSNHIDDLATGSWIQVCEPAYGELKQCGLSRACWRRNDDVVVLEDVNQSNVVIYSAYTLEDVSERSGLDLIEIRVFREYAIIR